MAYDPIRGFRMPDELWKRVNDAARAYGVDASTFVREALMKTLRDLAPEIEKRKNAPGLFS